MSSTPPAPNSSDSPLAEPTDPIQGEWLSPSAVGRAVRQMLEDMEEDAIVLEPPEIFDDCMLGITEGDIGPVRVIYDSEKCVQALMAANGWDYEESMDYFSFNTLGAHTEGYPIFLARPIYIEDEAQDVLVAD